MERRHEVELRNLKANHDQLEARYATSRSHHMTSIALASLWQEDDESLQKFMDKFS
ncbi:hypothetical protein JHK87_055455 [Glycine soja]|nr:hypothetical protein JHK87_055455 [Glycine soja]